MLNGSLKRGSLINHSRRTAVYCVVLLTALVACEHKTAANGVVTELSIKNLMQPADNRFVSGQPTQEELAELASLGVKHIINLRPQSEQDWDEQQHVESLGMNYVSIPVAGADDVTADNAQVLMNALEQIGSEPVLLHCASGNRVGGVVAMMEGSLKGKNIEESVNEGKRWGLTRLEPVVRENLANYK